MTLIGLVAMSDAGAAALLILICGLVALGGSMLGYFLAEKVQLWKARAQIRRDHWASEGRGGPWV